VNADAVLDPSDWVVRFGSLAPVGRVLDLACGGGRHSRWFAQRGHSVVAVDRDVQALQMLDSISGVITKQYDLERDPWPLRDEVFAAVIVTNYLHRPLFGDLLRCVDVGGILIYETFAHGNERYGRPSNPAFLLRSGELLDAVSGVLRVIAYEDIFRAAPKPAMIQRICAIRE
jgi:SAM-dependent methyltransferase